MRIKSVLLSSALIVLLAACSKEPAPVEVPDKPPVAEAPAEVPSMPGAQPSSVGLPPPPGEVLDLTHGDPNMMPMTLERAADYREKPDASALPAVPPPLTEAQQQAIRNNTIMPGQTQPGVGVPANMPVPH